MGDHNGDGRKMRWMFFEVSVAGKTSSGVYLSGQRSSSERSDETFLKSARNVSVFVIICPHEVAGTLVSKSSILTVSVGGHRTIELKLEKTTRTVYSNHQHIPSAPTNPCPLVPHLPFT